MPRSLERCSDQDAELMSLSPSKALPNLNMFCSCVRIPLKSIPLRLVFYDVAAQNGNKKKVFRHSRKALGADQIFGSSTLVVIVFCNSWWLVSGEKTWTLINSVYQLKQTRQGVVCGNLLHRLEIMMSSANFGSVGPKILNPATQTWSMWRSTNNWWYCF